MKTILITGAASGLGWALSQQAFALGHRVTDGYECPATGGAGRCPARRIRPGEFSPAGRDRQ